MNPNFHPRTILAEPTALRLIRPTSTPRVIARRLVLAAIVLAIVMLAAPWQQSLPGHGRVIAYAPLDRTQAIEAPIDGRVVGWMVEEGSHVAAGDAIARLADNDPEILARLERERDAARDRVEAARRTIELSQQRIDGLAMARSSATDGARMRAGMAVDRELAAQQAVDAAQASLTASNLNLDRTQKLTADGLASRRTLELAELGEQTARADLLRAKAALAAARREVKAMRAEVVRVESDQGAGVDAARVSLESARGEVARAEQDLARIEVRLARQGAMTVTAPRDGTVLRLVAREGGEMVKAGDPLAMFVPDTEARAVELWLDGLDAPLVTPGRKVRLQFEGWPAVQFVGWPSVAIGTFGGVVAFVDATDDGRGKFRVVVLPDFDLGPEDHWPTAQYLRQGVRANGWILLDEVRLGYELWRQFNGFPPVLKSAPIADAAPGGKHHDKEEE
ncbi:MAG: HlyD family efflux transporter periplasmic adaptor subunit [Myxococcales bacterium]|nr:HlyD family efflux transporter periplasmic adaptor subunit [Myxococcales bacterium]